MNKRGFPGGTSGKELACQCRRHKRCGFDPLVGKIPWRRAQQPIPGFLPGESHGQRSLVGYNPWGCKEYQTRLSDFTFTFKITTDGDCSHEIKRCLVLGRKAMTNLESILKSRDIALLTNVCIVKVMVFLVVMYGGKSGP